MRRPKRLLMTALVMAVAVPVAVPAPAAASVSGSIKFHCTAKLPSWPVPQSSGVCEDDATPAVAVVSLAGTDQLGVPYSVEGPGGFAAAFEYSAPCLSSLPPMTGTASGHAIVDDAPATYGAVSTTADVHVDFQWTRVGTKAAIIASGWTVVFPHGTRAFGNTGVGAATFLPLLDLTHVCPVGGSLKALVDGEVEAAS